MTTAAPEAPFAPETVEGRARRLAAFIQRALPAQPSPWDDRPIREELFSIERLEEHARSLAAAQPVGARRRRRNVLRTRLAENEADLLAAYHDVADAIANDAAITPAAEWLIDNFHVVERQVRDIRADLPTGFYRQLPELAAGPFQGLPRVFSLSWGLVAHTDSLFDPEALRRYVRAYQEVQPLTIGELWAVAITLRVVLVENLRRVARRVVASRAGRRQADTIADRLLGSGGRAVEAPAPVLADLERVSLSEAFFVQLVQRLRDQDPSIAPALAWIDERLARNGLTADEVVQAEHQRQVAGSVTVRNIITSMRLISDVDWSELVERISLVDDLLVAGSRFDEMDFPTRNLYRSAIEELARGSGRSELEIARAAVLAASAAGPASAADANARLSDPGYYLTAGGRLGFESAIGFRPPLSLWPGRLYRALGIGGYVGAGALAATLILALPLMMLARAGLAWPWLAALGVLGVAPAVDLAVALVNHVVTRGFRASLLPGLELKGGVPPSLRTLVVVPMLLTSEQSIAEHIEGLEVHYLASLGGDIRFALLADWADADAAAVDGDETLLALARAGIAELNRRHGAAADGDRFLILHRRRVWNKSERRWIGWERKRGKLAELNRYLRGSTDTTFVDPPPAPPGVRYVITLDSDTRLPRETVRRLIGKMAHPLNRPRMDPAQRRVIEGYAILQPRVTPSLPVGQQGSLFLRVFSSASGIDPYAAAVSDVYQDLFGEGSFTGKGIYDVDAFEAAIAGRVPESRMLSHDLFEGIFARAGLASDVEVVEAFPERYDTAALRHHRWARGDWQLLPWMLGFGRREPGARGRHGVPMVGRWKMLDNLRRSLSAPATVAALLAGWAAPADIAVVWTTFLVATMAVPPLLPVAAQATARRPGATLRGRLRMLVGDVWLAVVQIGLMLIFIAHQAWLMGDAILRTLLRLTITRRHLLQWTPAAQAAFGRRLSVASFYQRMAGGLAFSAAALAAGWLGGHGAWPIAAAFAAVWALAPAVALRASLSPSTADRRPLTSSERETLRVVARRTWRFFETFVTAESHWLPPDNFQETPEPVVANRTSPTNLGLYLLSTVSARDFGWIGTVEAVERLEATLATMRGLARYRGHFYNWYDTGDLRVLDPPYVSSVDSGNVAGHLIALAGACHDWASTAAPDADRLSGVADALQLVRQALLALGGAANSGSDVLARLLSEADARLSRLDGGAQADWAALVKTLDGLAAAALRLAGATDGGADELLFWANAARRTVESNLRDDARTDAAELPQRLAALEHEALAMALAMDFRFLLDPDRLLLSIGYQTVEGVRDPSCYDLLASEARLASFVAIAKGDAPARHWFRLGRSVTPSGHGAALISWSGSMFEYLMPSLVMRGPAASLIEQSNEHVVARQIEYGRRLGAPWGVSESAFNARDLEFTYQYSNFGVPGLGLKRGLADNTVIAPYATALAAMVDPRAAVRNFERLAQAGALGRYGYYEALDLTPARLPEGARQAVVNAFMAHHQGMSIVAIADVLLDGRMRRCFHADPMVRATELLLQERAARDIAPAPPSVAESAATVHERTDRDGWRSGNPWSATPDVQLLSNGRYSVMLTAAGSGYSAWGDLALTRWREDATCDDWGAYVFLRDVRTGDVWSAGLQPTGVAGDGYTAIFNEDRAEIARRDGTLTTTLEVVVSAEDDAEVRRVTLSNFGGQAREIEVTTYAELVLAPRAADIAHPAFSKLFVETEHLADLGALLAHRRRRAPDEPEVWVAQLAVVDGHFVRQLEFETDRARFIGRGRSVRAATAIVDGRPLSGTTGAVLDPIFALRRRVRLEPGETARIDVWTMAAGSREEVLGLVDKHHDTGAFGRAAALAWTQVQVQLHHLGISRGQAGQFQRLAGHVLFAAPILRPTSEIIQAGRAEQPLLWSLGISGDLPIVLVRISDTHQLGLVREALLAVEYWRMRRLSVDLVILNERASSYIQDLQLALETQVRANQSRQQVGEAGGHVFLLRTDLMPAEVHAMLRSVARVVLNGELGRLADQLEYAPAAEPISPSPPRRSRPPSELQIAPPVSDLEYFNGVGGFDQGGREYVVITGPGQSAPAPWINVIANPEFGFQVSAEGGGFSWARNSRERQITPWSNDPVTDQPSQVFYLHDEETGEVWTPTALPIRDEAATYVARHGFGYTRFEHVSRGLALEVLEYVAPEDPVRISRLSIRNASGARRRITVTAYLDWSLGGAREVSAPHVATRLDPATGAVLASTRWNPVYAERVAFADLGGRQSAWTGDRREFLGRNGGLGAPIALCERIPLSGRLGAGLDPCCALQATLDLAPGAKVEIPFFVGDAENETRASQLVADYRKADLDAVLEEVRRRWDDILGAVRVKTPDRSMDLMLNGWLLYQTISARLWARAGFYQASGAYGFRDQLQDVMALTSVRPSIARDQLLRAAARQFEEGDVQHWWLPDTGQGVRTRISDDRVWLPFVAAHYVDATGDAGVLDQRVPFIGGAGLERLEAERFFTPNAGGDSASLYEHCARALDVSLAVGAHGMPLIGGGDWNDGMNRVGDAGRGESVWLGWFLITNLRRFAAVADTRGDVDRAARWRAHADALAAAAQQAAWDGDWYRRGWFDDGSPLGSAASEECRIDSIAQSWAVLSGAEDRERAAQAMAAVDRELIRPRDDLALLFSPPFDRSAADPGYIKGYPPGVRENGGQYTHAALWSVMAFAALGEGDKASALFWILNPINHARTRSDAHRYRVEPYVVAADIYAGPGCMGRGGWTWYTGSAGWMQRAGVESILGLRRFGDRLEVDPCIPTSWPGFEVSLRFGTAHYDVVVANPNGVSRGIVSAALDGEPLQVSPLRARLRNDGETHRLNVTLG